MTKLFGLGCLVLLGLSGPRLAAAGAERAGTTSANFLSIGSGPRVLGMGGATLGLANGLGTAAWNAGSLGWTSETEIALSHAGLAEGIAQEWIGIGGGLGVSRIRWSLFTLYQTEGTFEGRDASNNSTGGFGVSSMAVGGHLARRIGKLASAGAGAKWVNESFGPLMRGSGFTFDGGLMVRAGAMGLGVAAQNIGGSMRFGGRTYPFPSNIGAGMGYEHRASGLRAGLDFNVPSAYYKDVRGGLEWSWKERLALRAGYRKELSAPTNDNLTGPTFGVGAGAYGLWLDYAYLVPGGGEGQHRMGIAFRPGAGRWRPGDPFGQRQMPREFETTPMVGPPTPESDTKKKDQ